MYYFVNQPSSSRLTGVQRLPGLTTFEDPIMALHDIGPGAAARIYDLFQTEHPQNIEHLRTVIRQERPGLSESATRQHVVRSLLRTPAQYRLLLRLLSLPQPEPRRTSPLEQVKGLTSLLNPGGEMTGRNYSASF